MPRDAVDRRMIVVASVSRAPNRASTRRGMRQMRLRGVLQPIMVVLCLVGAGFSGSLPVIASQEDSPANKTAKGTSAGPAVASVDPRYRSPRATVRTFLIAINRIEDDPSKIEDAEACLDLSEIPGEHRTGGRLALELEFILRSTNVPTWMIPDDEVGPDREIGEGKETKLTLHRMADGRWLFAGKTLRDLPKMRLFLWQKALAASQAKEASDVPADFRSPYAMFRSFIAAFKKNDLDAAAKCLDLTEIPDPARGIVGRQLAFKLKEVLDRTVFIIFQDLPDSSVGLPLEVLVHKEGQITAERQVEGARKGQWLFDKATVRSVDRLYNAFESEPILRELAAAGRPAGGPSFRIEPGLWLRHRLPGWLRYRIELTDQLSIALYQLLGMVVLFLLVLPVHWLIVRLFASAVKALMRWRGIATAHDEVAAWVRPTGWVAAVWLLIEGVGLLSLRMEPAGACLALLVPTFWLVLALAAYQLINPILKLVAGPAVTQGEASFAAMGFPVMSLVLKILVAVFGLATVLKLFGFDVGTVLAGLGIGGLAVALAAQDTLKNFFGSLMLIADRTFRVGDLVQIGTNDGVVETVGLRCTRIRALDDSLMTIPNSDLTTSHITNFGARRYRRFRTQLSIAYGTSPEALIKFREGILEQIRNHPSVRHEKYEVVVNDLGSSGIQLLIQVFFEVPDYHAELLTRDSLILDILRLAERLGIAFDTPTLLLERGQPETVQPYRGNADSRSAVSVD